jgi:hypothetical protein
VRFETVTSCERNPLVIDFVIETEIAGHCTTLTGVVEHAEAPMVLAERDPGLGA